jgi:large subunit ribosomal protein LX
MLCKRMSRLKVFRVTGEIKKPNLKTSFRKEIIAAKPEHATEKVYTELGSRHRVKRFYIKITSVEEVPIDEIEDPLLKKYAAGEKQVDK